MSEPRPEHVAFPSPSEREELLDYFGPDELPGALALLSPDDLRMLLGDLRALPDRRAARQVRERVLRADPNRPRRQESRGESPDAEETDFGTTVRLASECLNRIDSTARRNERGDPMKQDEADRAAPSVTDPKQELDFLLKANGPNHLGRIGHYEIVRVLGRGGMGVVVEAFDELLRTRVALKFLTRELTANADARRRFIREARALVAIDHPGVLKVTAVKAVRNGHVEEIDSADDIAGRPFLVMAFIDGDSLQERLNRDVREIVRIVAEVADGLAAVHKQGVVHRDVKPANILRDSQGRIVLIDFGLARATVDPGLTQYGEVTGTPHYMSPEQALGKPVDARGDLYSLGVVLYALLAGHPPFQGATVEEVLLQVREANPRPIRSVNPAVPEWLATILARLLARNPEDRYQSATEVAALLRKGLVAPAPPPLPVPPRERTRMPILVLCGVLIAGLAAYLWSQLSPAPTPIQSEHELLTREAWEAYQANDLTTVLERTGKCLREYRAPAERLQRKLLDENAPLPPEGKVSATVRQQILHNGLLNDVATCLWLKGRAHEGLKQTEEARRAYEQTRMLTYARCLDLKRDTFFSLSQKAEDDLENLDPSR